MEIFTKRQIIVHIPREKLHRKQTRIMLLTKNKQYDIFNIHFLLISKICDANVKN